MTSTQTVQVPVYVALASNEELARNMDELATIAARLKLPHGAVTRLARDLRAGKTVRFAKTLGEYAGELRMRQPYGAEAQKRMAGVVYAYVAQLPEWHAPFGIPELSPNNASTRAMKLSDEQLAARSQKAYETMTRTATEWAKVEAETRGVYEDATTGQREHDLRIKRVETESKYALAAGAYHVLAREAARRERAARDGVKY